MSHLTLGAEDVASAQIGLALAQVLIKVAQLFYLVQRVAGSNVTRFDGQHSPVAHSRRGIVTHGSILIGLGQQRPDRTGMAGAHRNVQFGIARVLLQALFEPGQSGFVLTLFDQGHTFFSGGAGTASGQAQANRENQARHGQAPSERVHGVLPTDSVWDRCKGR